MSKIRNGFVSNSSSSSFICNVCGVSVSGMDMCLSESGMIRCINGHTFCETHHIINNTVELTTEEKRQFLIAYLDTGYRIKWYSDHPDKKRAQIDWIMAKDEDGIDNSYNDVISETGEPECNCPICSFKDLDTADGLKYLLKKHSLTEKNVLTELKEIFKTYSDFKKYIKE